MIFKMVLLMGFEVDRGIRRGPWEPKRSGVVFEGTVVMLQACGDYLMGMCGIKCSIMNNRKDNFLKNRRN